MKNFLIGIPLLVLVALIVGQAVRRAGPPPDPITPRRPSVDWPAITRDLKSPDLGGRVDETSAYGRYLRSLESMDGVALVAAWEELDAAGLPPEARERLEPSLIGTLVTRDAERALDRFASHVADPPGGIGTQLFGAFRDLAERLPMKAALWLDRNIAAGIFGTVDAPVLAGDEPLRVIYERELIRALLASGTGQATGRLMELPEAWRAAALQGADPPQGQAAYAVVARQFLTPERQLAEFSRMASSAAYHGGAEGLARLLDNIGATAAERETILRVTAVPSR